MFSIAGSNRRRACGSLVRVHSKSLEDEVVQPSKNATMATNTAGDILTTPLQYQAGIDDATRDGPSTAYYIIADVPDGARRKRLASMENLLR